MSTPHNVHIIMGGRHKKFQRSKAEKLIYKVKKIINMCIIYVTSFSELLHFVANSCVSISLFPIQLHVLSLFPLSSSLSTFILPFHHPPSHFNFLPLVYSSPLFIAPYLTSPVFLSLPLSSSPFLSLNLPSLS